MMPMYMVAARLHGRQWQDRLNTHRQRGIYPYLYPPYGDNYMANNGSLLSEEMFVLDAILVKFSVNLAEFSEM